MHTDLHKQASEFTPGNIQNKIKISAQRAGLAAIGMDPYSLCFALENKYVLTRAARCST